MFSAYLVLFVVGVPLFALVFTGTARFLTTDNTDNTDKDKN